MWDVNKLSNEIWRPFPAFPAGVSEKELDAHIQKAIPEKPKIVKIMV